MGFISPPTLYRTQAFLVAEATFAESVLVLEEAPQAAKAVPAVTAPKLTAEAAEGLRKKVSKAEKVGSYYTASPCAALFISCCLVFF